MAADPLLPVANALARILAGVPLMPGEEIPVSAALGRVTAEPVRSRRTQPPVAMSAMDGYALAGSDLPEDGERRMPPPVAVLPRRAVRDGELAGARIRAGDDVLFAIASAMVSASRSSRAIAGRT